MIRNEWSFPYLCSAVAEGAQRKLTHHTLRLEWWKNQRDTAEEVLRSSGITIEEGVAAGYSGTMPARRYAVLDHVKEQRLAECESGVLRHSGLVNDYNRWMRVFLEHTESTVDLDVDDLEYFDLVPVSGNEED